MGWGAASRAETLGRDVNSVPELSHLGSEEVPGHSQASLSDLGWKLLPREVHAQHFQARGSVKSSGTEIKQEVGSHQESTKGTAFICYICT